MIISETFRRLLIRLTHKLWREIMKTYPITYCTTSPISYAQAEEPINIPESAALRNLINKFGEYRDKLAEEKDKKEFDDFLDILRKSTTDVAQ